MTNLLLTKYENAISTLCDDNRNTNLTDIHEKAETVSKYITSFNQFQILLRLDETIVSIFLCYYYGSSILDDSSLIHITQNFNYFTPFKLFNMSLFLRLLTIAGIDCYHCKKGLVFVFRTLDLSAVKTVITAMLAETDPKSENLKLLRISLKDSELYDYTSLVPKPISTQTTIDATYIADGCTIRS